jgi:hypothetical protein
MVAPMQPRPPRGRPAVRAVLLALLLAAPAWAVLPSTSPPAAAQGGEVPANLLRNGDFERGSAWGGTSQSPSFWRHVPDPALPDTVAFDHVSTVAHNGSRCAYVVVREGAEREAYWYQDVAAGEGAVIPFGAFVMAQLTAGSSVMVRVALLDDTHSTVGERRAEASSGLASWTELRGGAFEVPPGVRWLRFECVLKGSGEAWFDDAYAGRPTDMDNPPIILSVPPLEAAVGQLYSYRARAVDLDGDAVAFSLVAGPEGMTVSADGQVAWVPPAVPEGAVRVLINATDAKGRSGYQDFFLTVLPVARQRPVDALLVSAGDDQVNLVLSAERFLALMPAVEALRARYPDVDPSVMMLFSGAEATALSMASSGDAARLIAEVELAVAAGWAETGWSSLHEPTYYNNPLAAIDYGNATWDAIVQAMDDLMSYAVDPLTGAVLPGDVPGGLRAVQSLIGATALVALAAEDPAQLHALDRWDAAAVLLALSGTGRVVGPGLPSRAGVAGLASMLAEDPNAPYGVYWEGGHLRVATADLGGEGPPALLARDGPEALNATVRALDGRRSWVLPVLVMDRGLYCNGSAIVGGREVGSPTEWAYSHPGDPTLPAAGVRSPAERAALYDATNRTLEWLASDLLPSREGRFLSTDDLLALVDDGAGSAASAAELASAARDLIERRQTLAYPAWVGAEWGFCRGDYRYFSLAEMYGLLARALSASSATGALPGSVEPMGLVGPLEGRPPAFPYGSVRVDDIVAEATRQAGRMAEREWRVMPRGVVPSTSSPGGTEANAMEFLLLMAEAYLVLFDGGDPGSLVRLFPTEQWPLTLQAMLSEGTVAIPAASWAVRPASATVAQDRVPPAVARVAPAPGARGVQLFANVTVSFSERMDESRPLAGAIVLDPPILGELTWSAHRLVLDPVGPLDGNTTYTARISGSLEDLAGNPLGGAFSWSFTTTGAPNLPPVLTAFPNVSAVQVLENQTLRLGVDAQDDGPPPLAYRWTIDGALVAGAAGDELLYTPTYADEGYHHIAVVVSDAFDPPGVGTATWEVEVVNVNILPRLLGQTPAAGDVLLNETANGTATFRVDAVDPDEGFLRYTWTLEGAPVPPAALSDGGAAYAFGWGYDSAGNHTVACRVEDRQGVGFDVAWTVRVLDINRPPAITGITPTWTTTIQLGETFRVRANATDPDGDALSFEWRVDGTRAALTKVGQWDFTPWRDGSYTLSLNVSDARGGMAEAVLTVNVLPASHGPTGDGGGSWVPWLLVAAALVAIAVAIAWPELRRRRGAV